MSCVAFLYRALKHFFKYTPLKKTSKELIHIPFYFMVFIMIVFVRPSYLKTIFEEQ